MIKLGNGAIGIAVLMYVVALPTVETSLASQSKEATGESEQVLFLVDDSASMAELGFDVTRPTTSRWELVQEAYPQWLSRLAPDDLTGLVTVGGECNAAPGISIPVSSERTRMEAALKNLSPHGSTKLNAVLQSSPSLFNLGVRGHKRVVLLSDGLNTCQPSGSTCEIARDLHTRYGIAIDVVSLVTDPTVEHEFKCVASATDGNFSAPDSFADLVKIRIGQVNAWPYIVLTLTFMTLVQAARILYRQAVHSWRWSVGKAVAAGGIMLCSGLLSAYLALFFRTGALNMLLGLLTLAAIVACCGKARRATGCPDPSDHRTWLNTLLSIAVMLIPLLCVPSMSAQALPATCNKIAQGPPRYHHVIALDLSGSVVRHLPEMKLLVACYATDYALPGEQITLVVFGTDSQGSVKEIQTFVVPPSGSTDILNSLLDDLAIQNPTETRTYFRPLADFLNQFLKNVQLQPIVLVISDGRSDGFHDAATGRVDFREIPFESLGRHGIYSAPGMRGWRVAIDTGSAIDLSALFQHMIVGSSWKEHARQPLGPVLNPCLVDPQIYFEPDSEVSLMPSWNPADQSLRGHLHISVTSECVTRLRSFRVQWVRGQDTLDIGSKSSTPIGGSPRLFDLPLSKPADGTSNLETSVQLLLDQGNSTRVIYPQKNAITRVREVTYWEAHGRLAFFFGLALFCATFSLIAAVRKHSMDRHNRPQFVKPLGGFAVGMHPASPVSIGGEGCDIAIPDLPPRTVLAYAEPSGDPASILVHPEPGFHLRVNGRNVAGSTVYRLGQQMQLVSTEGVSLDLKLFAAKEDEVGFGTQHLDTSGEIGFSVNADGITPTDNVRDSSAYLI
jgi:hypothetical protein